jgi:hypothetical protein
MQIVEVSVFGLRVARYRFIHPDSGCSVTLFPMIHIGEPDFYERVYRDASTHDVVLVEGMKSRVGRRLTRTYRWIGQRLGLIIQPRFAGPPGVRVVLADLSTDEFHREWRKVPLWLRLAAYLLTPLVGLRMRWFASRESIAKHLGLEDRLSAEEILSWNPEIAALKHGLLHARDARLIAKLGEELDRSAAGEVRLAILYGATHMRAVLKELNRRRFLAKEAEWLTVFYL